LKIRVFDDDDDDTKNKKIESKRIIDEDGSDFWKPPQITPTK